MQENQKLRELAKAAGYRVTETPARLSEVSRRYLVIVPGGRVLVTNDLHSRSQAWAAAAADHASIGSVRNATVFGDDEIQVRADFTMASSAIMFRAIGEKTWRPTVYKVADVGHSGARALAMVNAWRKGG